VKISARENDFAAYVPSEMQRADTLLTQYGRWATSYGRNSTPGTLDRMYIREADRKESLEAFIRRRNYVPSEPLMPVLEALVVQRALQKVADRERIVLTILYVPRREPIPAQLRMLRITPSLCRMRHQQGLREFGHWHDVLSLTRACSAAAFGCA
jgi:hypothetical protein